MLRRATEREIGMSVDRPRGRRTRAARYLALTALLVLAWAPGGLAEESAQHAIASRLATETLLLDVARAGERLVAVGEWGHVVLSDDGGKTWRQARSVPTRMTLTEVAFVGARRGWAVGHDAVVLHTSDGGETWELQFSDPEEEATLLSVWFENADHGIAVGSFGLAIETQDGGRSWERRTLLEDEDPPHLNHLFAGPEGTLFIAAEFAWVYRSRDDGRSWERFRSALRGLALGRDVARRLRGPGLRHARPRLSQRGSGRELAGGGHGHGSVAAGRDAPGGRRDRDGRAGWRGDHAAPTAAGRSALPSRRIAGVSRPWPKAPTARCSCSERPASRPGRPADGLTRTVLALPL